MPLLTSHLVYIMTIKSAFALPVARSGLNFMNLVTYHTWKGADKRRAKDGQATFLFSAALYRKIPTLRLNILQKPIRGDFFAESLFFGGAKGAVAHGGELDSGAHVVEKEGDLLIAGAARNPAH